MGERAEVFRLLFFIFAYFHRAEGNFDDCRSPLGIQNGTIPDSSFYTTMKTYGDNWKTFGPPRARLNSSSGFRADPASINTTELYAFAIDLPNETIVTEIATQGLGKEWVKSFEMSFAHGNDVEPSLEYFKGNIDGDTIKFNKVPKPVKTTQVFLWPIKWHKNIALRLELYGCEPGYHFKVWLKVLNTTFRLSFMNFKDEDTKHREEIVLMEVKEYLKNVKGFLSTKLYQFSPPQYIHDLQDSQTSTTAEIEIYCIESASTAITKKLKKALANQGGNPVFGTTILQTRKPNGGCRPPSVSISIGKDPFRPQLVLVDITNRMDKFTVTANLNPACNATGRISYSWETAGIDIETGLFGMIFPWGRQNTDDNKLNIGTHYLPKYELHYIRCIVRNYDSTGVYVFNYDFGFLKLVRMRPLRCAMKPSQGKAAVDKFALSCSGSYIGMNATSYNVTLDLRNQLLVIAVWRSLNRTITLPPGNPKDDYKIGVKVEAKFPSLPSLFAKVLVKVRNPEPHEIAREVEIVKDLITAGKFEEAAYNIWILQTVLDELIVSVELRRKVKSDLIQSMTSMKMRSLQQLNQTASFVMFSNEIIEETTQEILNNSIYILQMAIDFLNVHGIRNLSEGAIDIKSIIDNLLHGTTHILAAASDAGKAISSSSLKGITNRAIELLYRLSVIRGSSVTDEDQFQATFKDVSILQAKMAKGKLVFRLKGDEVHLPEEFFSGEFGDLLRHGTVKIIRFTNNPYLWNQGAIPGNVSYIDITFWHKNETKIRIYNLSQPIRIVFPRAPEPLEDRGDPDEGLFLTKKIMRYHKLEIPSHEATVTVRIQPEKNITLGVYVRHGSRPTPQHYDFNDTLPKAINSSCLSTASEKYNGCTSRDPYEFDILPNVTGQNGLHFIGIEILESSTDASAAVKSHNGEEDKLPDQMSCVEVKPAPTTPPTVKRVVPRKFDSRTDVRYTFLAKVASCVFWDEGKDQWSVYGVKVSPESNESSVQCLSNHLTTFSGYLYVAPNNIDFDKVLDDIVHLPPENTVVLSTVCLIFVCYAVGLIFARRADNRDKRKVVNTEANFQGHEESNAYHYEVFVQTGMWYGNGTTARVGMMLFGEDRNSDIIYFMDPWRESKLFTRGSVNTFTFDLPNHLGQVYKIKIWHDNGGKRPSWFLYQVGVKELSTGETWHFIANRWLAVESPDGAIDVEVQAASKKELTRFKSLFQWRAITSFADRHLFLSLFFRPPQNPFTRCQRLTCMLSIILVSLVTNAMFYRNEKTDDPNSFRLGPLELSLRQIIVGVQSGLIALPVNILTVLIFRNTKRKVSVNELKNSGTSSSPTQAPGFLPPCFIVIGWLICLTASITSGTFAIFYSVQWGAEKANRWLLSVGVSLLQDILLTGPIIIMVNTSIMSCINRKPSENNDIEKKTGQANLVHVVQEDEQATSKRPSEEELLRARRSKLQQKRLRRFFMDLLIYVIYVILLMTVCYADRKPSSYVQTKSLKDTFSAFYEVNDAKSLWTWFEKELVPGLYDSRKSLNGTETGLTSGKIGFVVGIPKIRQIRIKSDPTCSAFKVESVLRKYFNQCLSDFSTSNEDTTPYYKPGWKSLSISNLSENTQRLEDLCPEPWRYKEPMGVGDFFLPYGGGGYIAKLGYDADTALMVKRSMEENNWIDDKSAAVIVEFIIFEPANLLLTEVMLLFEKFANSRRSTRIDVIPQHIFPSSGSTLRTFYRVSILLWLIVILVLFFLEIIKMLKQGRAYFKSFFSWVSILQILSSCCAGLTVFLKENILKDFLQRIRSNPFGDWSPFELLIWSKFEEIILSIAVVTTTIKSLKLIQLNRHVHVMKSTLQRAYRYLTSFSIIILMLSLAFAQFGTLLFGAKDEEYATLYYSLQTVLQMAIGIGKIQVNKMNGDSSSEWFAPIYLFACMLCLTIIFVNTFIAILDNAFHQANDREYPGEGAFAYMRESLRSWIKKTGNTDPNNKMYRESPFRKTIRRKSSLLLLKRKSDKLAETESLLSYERAIERESSIQLPNDNVRDNKDDSQDRFRAKLAESESLLSYESLSLDEDTNNLASNQFPQVGSNNVETEIHGAEFMDPIAAEDGFEKTKEFYIDILLAEEEHLLSDIARIMQSVRSDFIEALGNDDEWYSQSPCSSLYDGSLEDLNESASVLSLIQACKDSSNRNAWSYVRGIVKLQGLRLHRTLRRQSKTYSEEMRESFI